MRKNKKDLTVAELFELYKEFKKPDLKESSYIEYCAQIKNKVLPMFANTKIRKLTSNCIIKWKSNLDNTDLSYSSKQFAYIVFQNLIGFAVEHYKLPKNVVSRTGRFKDKEFKKKINFWTETEFLQFLSVVDNMVYKAFFATLYLSGLRRGEALALNWKDIDFENNIIDVTKSYTHKSETSVFKITSPKNRSSVRKVLITEELAKILAGVRKHYELQGDFSEENFVFGGKKPFEPATLRWALIRYTLKAGLKKIVIHDFRHSHASLLINRGADPVIVADRLGHSDVKLTLNTYSHLWPSRQKELIEMLKINAFEYF